MFTGLYIWICTCNSTNYLLYIHSGLPSLSSASWMYSQNPHSLLIEYNQYHNSDIHSIIFLKVTITTVCHNALLRLDFMERMNQSESFLTSTTERVEVIIAMNRSTMIILRLFINPYQNNIFCETAQKQQLLSWCSAAISIASAAISSYGSSAIQTIWRKSF